jgi:type VI secretion system secreted protein VgrG
MDRRALTEGEIATAREAFGDGVDYDRIRIGKGPGRNPVAWLARRNGNPAITLVNTIHLFGADLGRDFSAGADRMLFLHEMTHVWQYDGLGVPRMAASSPPAGSVRRRCIATGRA